jgi:tetratricopeptide (TPR) repeat protein
MRDSNRDPRRNIPPIGIPPPIAPQSFEQWPVVDDTKSDDAGVTEAPPPMPVAPFDGPQSIPFAYPPPATGYPPYPPVYPGAGGPPGQPSWSSPPQRRPKPSRAPYIAITVVVLVVGSLVGLSLIKSMRQTDSSTPVGGSRYVESEQSKRREILAAFQLGPSQPITLATADLADIRSVLTAMANGDGKSDPSTRIQYFDTRRLASELVAKVHGKDAEVLKKPEFAEALKQSMIPRLAQGDFSLVEPNFEIRQVRSWAAQPDEVVVYLTSIEPDGTRERVRLWLRRDGGHWRIFDFEDVRVGLRLSQLMSAVFANNILNNPAALNQIQAATALFAAARKEIDADQFDQAKKSLAGASSTYLPESFEALRLTMIAICDARSQRPQEALNAANQASQHSTDLPLTELVKAEALFKLDRHDEALAALSRYEAAIGADSFSCKCRGQIMIARGEWDQAATQFRAGLDDDPISYDCFAGLCRRLGGDAVPELRKRLSAFPDPKKTLSSMADEAIGSRFISQLAAAVSLYEDRGAMRNDPRAVYYKAELAMLRKQWPEAAKLFEDNRSLLQADASIAQSAGEEHAASLIHCDRPLDAYRVHPDKVAGMQLAADHLCDLRDADRLEQLVSAHRAARPDDAVRIAYYSGAVEETRGQHAKAEPQYRAALAAASTDEWKSASINSLERVLLAQSRVGDAVGLTARGDKAAHDKSIAHLVKLARDNKQPRALRELADLVQAESPRDLVTAWYRAEAAWIEKDYAKVVELLSPNRTALIGDARTLNWVPWRLVQSLVRLDRAREALQQIKQIEAAGKQFTWLHTLASTAAQDVPDAITRLDRLLTEKLPGESELLTFHDLQEDPDFSKALALPALADWVKRQKAAEAARSAATRRASGGTGTTRPI